MIEYVATIADADGDTATTSIRSEDPILATVPAQYARAWAQALNDIIGGIIQSVRMYVIGDISGLTSNSVEAGSNVEKIAAFQFVTAAGNRVDWNIPSMDETVLNSLTSDSLDLADPQVDAVLSMAEDGLLIGAVYIQPCDAGEDDIVSTVFAHEEFRNSGTTR